MSTTFGVFVRVYEGFMKVYDFLRPSEEKLRDKLKGTQFVNMVT